MPKSFAYIGKPLTGPAFVAYVQSYDFGTIQPDGIVIHNSVIPDASWAPYGDSVETQWDRHEAGLSDQAIALKRQLQLDAIMRFYRDQVKNPDGSVGWPAGPHLFVDDRWIWLFSPMYDAGVHAAEANSYHDSHLKFHYTLGVETIGYFGKVGWPPSMQALLRTAVQALRDRLGTFEIAYKPAPLHHPELHQGSISFHRDYNKQSCPGAFITPEYAIPILAAPASPPVRHFKVRGLPIYQAKSLSGTLADHMKQGDIIEIDAVYSNGSGHLKDGR